MAHRTVFPPDTQCFVQAHNHSHKVDCSHAKVSAAMVNFLNLSSSMDVYRQAYCLNPPHDDSCPFGYCPHPDVAGILVRVSTYVATFFFSILLVFAPDSDGAQEAYLASLVTLYGLLVTSMVSMFNGAISRYHAIVVGGLAASPLRLYACLITVLNTTGHLCKSDGYRPVLRDRLSAQQRPSWLAAVDLATLVFLLAYFPFVHMNISHHGPHYFQPSCDAVSFTVKHTWHAIALPFLASKHGSPLWVLPGIISVTFPTLSFLYVALKNRRDLKAASGVVDTIATFLDILRKKHRFICFKTIIVIPMAYWITVVEQFLSESPMDSVFAVSFGQILSVFVAVPSILGVVKWWVRRNKEAKWITWQPYYLY